MIFWVVALPCPAPYDYAEGDTATWIWMLRHGQALYASPEGASLPFLRSNYPPTFLWLTALLSPTDGQILLWGRILAGSGLLATTALAGYLVLSATKDRLAAGFTCLLLFGTARAGFLGLTCRPDPLGLGLAMVGVTLALLGSSRHHGLWRLWPLGSALFFALALLCKQSLVVFPVATTLFALVRREQRRFVLGGAGVVLGATLFAVVVFWVLHLDLFGPLVRWSVAPWTLANYAFHFVTDFLPAVPGIAVCFFVLRTRNEVSGMQRTLSNFLWVTLGVALLWSFSLGRLGSSANYLLELYVVVALCSGLGLFRLRQQLGDRHLHRLLSVHVAWTAVEGWCWTTVLLAVLLPTAVQETHAAEKALRNVEGAVLAEQPWHTTRLGRPPVLTPFLATQMAHSGTWDDAPLRKALEEGAIARVILEFRLDDSTQPQGGHADRLPAAVLPILRQRYVHLSSEGQIHVYGPRELKSAKDLR